MQNTPPTGTPRRVRPAHESKSAAVRAAAAAPSRRQRSRWQREQQHQRALYLAIGGLFVLVAAIFGGGIFYDNVVRANEVVAQIGPDSITAAQLVDRMRQPARRIDGTTRQNIANGATAAAVQQQADDQKRQLPDQTLNNLIDQHLIQQEAARRGISVAPSDLDDRERQTVADFNKAVNPPPTPEPTATAEGAEAATPTAAPTPNPDVSPTALASPTPNPTLTTDAYGPALQQLLDRNFLTEPELRDALQQDMLRQDVQDAIGKEQVPETQEQVHARHILLATEDQARDVLQQLQNGADFATLAGQLSTDPGSKSKGGDLGWFSRGVMDKPFEDAAFSLQPGQLSDVVHGANGYHVIQVLERDPNRQVPPDQLQSLRSKASNDWLDGRRTSQDVKLQLSQPERDWVLGRFGVRP